MSEEFFSSNQISNSLNLPFGDDTSPFRLNYINDEKIEQEDSFFNFHLPPKLFEDENENSFEKIVQTETKFTTLNKKTNHSKDLLINTLDDKEKEEEKKEEENENDIMEDMEDMKKESNQMQNNETLKKKSSIMGRKRYRDEIEGKHTKDSEDNMLRKIKSFFVGSFHNYLNSTIKNPELKLTKIDFYVSKELKKEFNENLFKATLKQIYETVNISGKYTNLINNEPNRNKIIIARIFKENKEVEAIKILNLTFWEVYEIFICSYCPLRPELRKKIEGTSILISKEFSGIKEFLKYIQNKFEIEQKKKKIIGNIEEYIIKIKELCLGLKECFKKKNGRKNRKEIKYTF